MALSLTIYLRLHSSDAFDYACTQFDLSGGLEANRKWKKKKKNIHAREHSFSVYNKSSCNICKSEITRWIKLCHTVADFNEAWLYRSTIFKCDIALLQFRLIIHRALRITVRTHAEIPSHMRLFIAIYSLYLKIKLIPNLTPCSFVRPFFYTISHNVRIKLDKFTILNPN